MPHRCTACGRLFPDGSREMLTGCPDCNSNTYEYLYDPQPSESEREDADGHSERTPGRRTSPPDHSGQTADKSPNDRHAQTKRYTDAEEYTSIDAPEDAAQRDARSTLAAPDELPDVSGRWPASGSSETATGSSGESKEWPERNVDAGAGGSRSKPSGQPEPNEPDHRRSEASDSNVRDADPDRTTPPQKPRTTQPPGGAQESKSVSSETERTTDVETVRSRLNDQFESIRIVEPGQYEINLMELYKRDEYIIELQEDGRYVIEVPDGWGGGE